VYLSVQLHSPVLSFIFLGVGGVLGSGLLKFVAFVGKCVSILTYEYVCLCVRSVISVPECPTAFASAQFYIFRGGGRFGERVVEIRRSCR